MKRLLLFVLLIPLIGYAQFDITGKVVDMNNSPVDYAEVLLLQLDSTAVASKLTNAEGDFSISDVAAGNYQILIRSFSQKLYEQKIVLTDNLDLKSIKVNKQIDLQEVVVESKTPIVEQKVDRLVFNIANSVTASSGDALEALKVTPGIRVQNDAISMIGKSNMIVAINGRVVRLSGEDLNNFLRSISADDIKSIEVITTPPSKYEAEGNSGIINIIYKKGRKNSWNNSSRMAYIQTTYPAVSLGNTFKFSKNKFDMSLNLDNKIGDEASITKYDIFFPNNQNESELRTKNQQDSYSGRLGVDYDISDKTSIGAILQYNLTKPNKSESNLINIYDDTNFIKSYINTDGQTTEDNITTSSNIHFRQQIDTLGKNVSIDLDYFNYVENKSREFASSQYEMSDELLAILQATNEANQNISNYSARIDFEHPTKNMTFTYGGKLTHTQTDSDVKFFNRTNGDPILDPSQSNEFEYKENIQALYIDATKQLNKKLQSKIGLRMESTQTTGISATVDQTTDRNYVKFFPTLFMSYSANDKNNISLKYSKRIKRPAFWELNPFRWYLNSNSYTEGNPFLQPAYSDNVELTVAHKRNLFTTLVGSFTTNSYGQIPKVNAENNTQIYTRENFYSSQAFGIVQVYIFNKFPWWQSYLQGNLFYVDTDIEKGYEDSLPEQSGVVFYAANNNSFVLNTSKTLIAEMNFWYNAPNSVQLFEQSSSMSLDFGLKWFLMDRNLQIGLTANDIFKTSAPDLTAYTDNIKQVYNNYYDNRYYKISLKYSFGNKKVDVYQRDFGNETEQNRIN